MTWVRYDDNVGRHPKIRALDDATYRLWREAIEWCSQNLTDGVVLAHELGLISTRANPGRARKLVTADLWHRAGCPCESDKCPPSGVDGWVIHDYWDYQRKRGDILAEREANRERQRKWMEKARAGKKGANTSSNAAPNAPPNAAPNASSNGNPAPPRPAPEGRGGASAPSAGPPPMADGAAATGEWKNQNQPPDSPNGPVRPPNTSGLRKTLAEARRRARRGTGPPGDNPQVNAPTALERLREATPDVATLVEAEEAQP